MSVLVAASISCIHACTRAFRTYMCVCVCLVETVVFVCFCLVFAWIAGVQVQLHMPLDDVMTLYTHFLMHTRIASELLAR
jgi:hypothetical protein